MRIGHGFDAHCFAANRPLIIGGVSIPHEQGLEAHSDGDVLIHALCDALLGAAALGDIGAHFPDSSDAYAGVDSRILLRSVIDSLAESGWQVGNVDMTVIAQAPKLAPYIPKMREILAEDIKTNLSAVSVKATTTEKMGYIGRKEGIAAHAVALIVPASS
ncbi:MAG: 2-C-methyl-D-erythritol 2,4-cyclodiphosphate synthase [Gammaproteobacteria bacterium]|nr:2-C-methyl-D-erythritol 2,4-cyclodiphosphate synthase [Gammaproteobacteria bacterium]